MIQLTKKLLININKKYMTTTTETITKEPENDNVTKPNENEIIISDQTKTEPTIPSTVTIQDILSKTEENKKIYESILEKPVKTHDEIKNQIYADNPVPLPSIKKPNETFNEPDFSNDSKEQTYQELAEEIQYPITETFVDQTTAVEEAVLPIIASCKLTGDALAKKMVENGIMVEESEKAEIRQEALYVRIKQFVDSFGITKTALKIGCSVAILYTIYNLIRYRQIPLGGFIKGLFMSSTGSTSEVASNIVSPTNNITIHMPSLDTIKQNIPLPTSTPTIGNFIDQLGATGVTIIGVLFWLMKKIK